MAYRLMCSMRIAHLQDTHHKQTQSVTSSNGLRPEDDILLVVQYSTYMPCYPTEICYFVCPLRSG